MNKLELMQERWTEHLEENEMNYWQHLKFAIYAATVCSVHCIRLFIHAVLPCFNRKALRDIHVTASNFRAGLYITRMGHNKALGNVVENDTNTI